MHNDSNLEVPLADVLTSIYNKQLFRKIKLQRLRLRTLATTKISYGVKFER